MPNLRPGVSSPTSSGTNRRVRSVRRPANDVVNWPQISRERLWFAYHKSEIVNARPFVSPTANLHNIKDISETPLEPCSSGIVFAELFVIAPRPPESLMDSQRTVRRHISCVGIGLHSGNKVNLTLKPAPADSGIRFRRTDLGDHEVPATVHNLAGIQLATGLSRNEVSVETVEHLLAALVSMGIDNVIVELNSPEVPIMDGSAAPFIYLIHEAGIKRLNAPRKYL